MKKAWDWLVGKAERIKEVIILAKPTTIAIWMLVIGLVILALILR